MGMDVNLKKLKKNPKSEARQLPACVFPAA